MSFDILGEGLGGDGRAIGRMCGVGHTYCRLQSEEETRTVQQATERHGSTVTRIPVNILN